MATGLREYDIQNLHTTEHEQLTDQKLFLITICAVDLVRKHSGGWDKEHPEYPLMRTLCRCGSKRLVDGLTFDFFSDPLVRKDILVNAQCDHSIITFFSTQGKDTIFPRRTTKILSVTKIVFNRRPYMTSRWTPVLRSP